MSKLITASELQTEVRNSGSRYTVIDNQSGQVYSTNIEPKKLIPMSVRVMGKKDNSFDTPSKKMDTNWFVGSPAKAFKNYWHTEALKAPKKESEHSILIAIWEILLEAAINDESRELVKIGGDIDHSPHGDYFSVEVLSNKEMKAFYNKEFRLRYFKITEWITNNQGIKEKQVKEIWV
jgi:hypothetical protein